MKRTVDLYATMLITVEVEAENEEEAKSRAFGEDLDAIAKRKIEQNNGLPEFEYELAD